MVLYGSLKTFYKPQHTLFVPAYDSGFAIQIYDCRDCGVFLCNFYDSFSLTNLP